MNAKLAKIQELLSRLVKKERELTASGKAETLCAAIRDRVALSHAYVARLKKELDQEIATLEESCRSLGKLPS
jgi:hypothetical protein